jgi:hypothetical protein
MARPRRRFVALLPVLAVLVLGLLAFGREGRARLQPYYVLSGTGTLKTAPRVLFVVDTSGSMAWQSQETSAQCAWSECENGDGAAQSRIAAAREAIRNVVAATETTARFGLMTFEQYKPPTSVPAKCNNGARFAWASHYGYFSWADITQHAGFTGTWRLCDPVNRPYPYLRWDELGVGSVVSSDGETGDVPASPLISVAESDLKSTSNATRRVQWFPEFMGVRVNLNDDTDPNGTILAETIGDFADDDNDRLSEVWGQDFYYWPYVDGFPGYSAYVAYPYEKSSDMLGIAADNSGVNAASLYAPFYLDLSETAIPDTQWGPTSESDANDRVLDAVSPMIEGGLDAAGGTPWSSAIGSIPAFETEDNSQYSHSSVASYLKFVSSISEEDSCAPTIAVLVTDGQPSTGEGGATLYSRLAALRNELDVKTYVVGFFLSGATLNKMACAAAGACSGTCDTPCDDTPAKDWDTCSNADDPGNDCAYLANSTEELSAVLTEIVSGELSTEIGSGPAETLNDFGVGAAGQVGEGEIVQTQIEAYTEWPGWKGHVMRTLCDAEDPDSPGQPASYCVDKPFDLDLMQETFGPCPQSRTWDAGECLQQTTWSDRRLYSHDASNVVYAINEEDGSATAKFIEELEAIGLVTGSDTEAEADAIVAFLLGKDWPSGWKLPGLANAAPAVVRRIPRFQPSVTPTVAIRDPHCAGRELSNVAAAGLPDSLETFAKEAWDADEKLATPTEHYEYQEAVLVGDDLGVLHAFQLDSGNELWGFLPRTLLDTAVQQVALGSSNMGQPEAVDDHIYGIAGTVNHTWVFDDRSPNEDLHAWRHLGVLGLGAGGTELLAFDLSHMSPESPDGPLEVLWTTEDAALAADYDARLGETWSRPAIVYEVPGNALTSEPDARLVFGTGYQSTGTTGRAWALVDALTGELLDEGLASDPAAETYKAYGDYGTVADVAVGSHCISRFWAEMQEAYAADTAGRLFRWDLGEGEADSDRDWSGAQAWPVTQLPACQGLSDTCNVGGGKADVFTFAPSVTANDRIDDPGGSGSGDMPQGIDQFLVALVSGSIADSDLDGTDPTSDFHSSLYLLVDDHSSGDPNAGFDIPTGAPKSDPDALDAEPHYMRLALSDIGRTRTFTPFAGSPQYVETRNFARRARPIRSPRISVTGVLDTSTAEPTVIEGVEVFRVTFTVFEPAAAECDARWYDSDAGQWYVDEGAVYELTFRLTALSSQGFDFANGAGDAVADFSGGLGSSGLVLESVTQVTEGGCNDGSCGPRIGAAKTTPCDGNVDQEEASGAVFAMPMSTRVLPGFTPVE